jgi:chorismate mutase/prephenate dehydratase
MDLKECRAEIDRINSEMLELFAQRMEICKLVAEYKAENGMPILAPEREKEILSTVTENASPEIRQYATELFSVIMKLSRDYQDTVINGKK